MFGNRLIKSNNAGAACTTDTVQILDGSPFESIATYQLDGNANDLTTNYNGTWGGTEAYGTGVFGQAAVFNGSSRIDVNISLTGTKSFSFWFQDNGLQTSVNNHFFSSTQNNCNFVLNNIDNSFALYDGSSTQAFSYTVNDSNWHHIVLSIDNTTATLYVDNGTGESITINSSSLTGLKFGTNQSNGSGIIGKLDQVRIYNKALSTSDVTTLYNETVSTASTNPTFNGPSCVAYYKMSDATDETGSYDGTPTNVNFNVAGKFGNAGEFNGTSSYISGMPSISNEGGNSSSVSIWFKSNSIPSASEHIFSGIQEKGTNDPLFSIFINTSGHLVYEFRAVTPEKFITDTTNYCDGNWHNVIATIDSSNMHLYIDGQESTSSPNSSFSGTMTIDNCVIGARNLRGTIQLFFTGSIDQVRIFNRAITANEVTTLYDEVQCIPTIVPTEHFNPVIYTGNGSTQSITGVGFEPDLVWVKSRTTTSSNVLVDSVRGATNTLFSDLTNAELVRQSVTSFSADGFSVGNYGNVNTNAADFVSWNFKAGGAAVAAASIAATNATRSANVDAGFSVMKFHTSASTASPPPMNYIEHGLDATPEMVIYKSTSNTGDWRVMHVDNGQKWVELNTADASAGPFPETIWDNTSTNIGVRSNYAISRDADYIAYAFHSVDGYSKFGSYVGTGAAGNSIVTGFRPAFIMFKSTSAQNWNILDNKRNTTNPLNLNLRANTSDAESSTGDPAIRVDFNSNGWTIVGSGAGTGQINSIGQTYIFMAFAEEVFVPDNFFNDDSTLATYKLDGDAGDDSGNGYNGTASNVTYAAGKFDEAGVFNGSSSYVTTPLDFNNLTDYSISMWIYIPATLSNNTFFAGTLNSSALNGIYFLINTNNTIRWYERSSSASITQITSTDTITVGSWNNFVAVRNGGTNYLYVNNGTPVSASNASITHATDFTFGRAGAFTTRPLNGSIDQVRIFNRALDSGEVTQLYNE